MGRTSGTPNKITAEVRDKLQNIDELVIIRHSRADNNQKLNAPDSFTIYTTSTSSYDDKRRAKRG